MTEHEQIMEIVKKYDRNFGKFSKEATHQEFHKVMKYVANESNRRQRILAGLEKDE